MNNYSFALKINDTTFIFKYVWNMTVKYVRASVNLEQLQKFWF